MESHGFRLSISKMKYIECMFGKTRFSTDLEVKDEITPYKLHTLGTLDLSYKVIEK